MKQLDFKDFAVATYSKLVEESILLYLQSEEAVAKLNLTPEKKKELRNKIKEISTEVAEAIIGELIEEGAFTKGLSKSKEKKIIQKVIERRIKDEK